MRVCLVQEGGRGGSLRNRTDWEMQGGMAAQGVLPWTAGLPTGTDRHLVTLTFAGSLHPSTYGAHFWEERDGEISSGNPAYGGVSVSFSSILILLYSFFG